MESSALLRRWRGAWLTSLSAVTAPDAANVGVNKNIITSASVLQQGVPDKPHSAFMHGTILEPGDLPLKGGILIDATSASSSASGCGEGDFSPKRPYDTILLHMTQQSWPQHMLPRGAFRAHDRAHGTATCTRHDACGIRHSTCTRHPPPKSHSCFPAGAATLLQHNCTYVQHCFLRELPPPTASVAPVCVTVTL